MFFIYQKEILIFLAPLSVFNENSTEINSSNRASCVTSSTTNARTPSRMSFRMNPDGSRVRVSRPPLPTNHQSPLANALRRVRNFHFHFSYKIVILF